MDSRTAHAALRIPQQTLARLSFAEASEKGIAQWLGSLPKANIGETARQLYQGMIELNQLQTTPERRLAMLELVRHDVDFVCKALARHYLGHSIVLEDKPRKVANLCQALENHLASGYKILVSQSMASRNNKDGRLLATALQRGIRCLSGPLLRAYQLYCPVSDSLWLELHLLYQISREYKLHQQPVNDSLSLAGRSLTPEHSYLVALLLGCSRPNQVRQSSLEQLYRALDSWAGHVRLTTADDPEALFIINPLLDCPPRYRSLVQGETLDNSLGLDTSGLVDALKHHLLDETDNSDIQVPKTLGLEIIQHLSHSWGNLAERSFSRVPGRGKLELSIGMSACHYHLSGVSFVRFIDADETHANPFSDKALRNRQEGWSNAFDGDSKIDWHTASVETIDYSGKTHEQEEDISIYPVHSLPIVNHSPGGFCLSWPREVPRQLQAGELLCVREAGESDWSLAVARWIRQVRGGGTQMGIELIAPHCTPCAAKLLRKTEEPSQYLRALMLPEIRAIDRPASLITPRMPFQLNSKVMVMQGNQETRMQLTARMAATGSFSQFEYKVLEQSASPGDQTRKETTGSGLQIAGDDDFDSLWKSL